MLKKIDTLSSSSQSTSFESNCIIPILIKKKFISEIYSNNKLEDELILIEPKTYVDLSYWNLTDYDMLIIIKQFFRNKQCIELRLCGNKITSKGTSILASSLINNSILKSLDLSYNHISDKGVYSLSKVLLPNQCSSLKILFLNKNGISNDGIYYLCEMLRTNQTLTELWLSDNEIGNEGVIQLTNILINYNRKLKVLTLSYNIFITDSSIDYLLQMLEYNKTLEKFSINNCNLSETSKMKLQEKADTKKIFEIVV
ncbi:unnamed protein product [Rotaria sordida]|uniref:Uncharacterized protein n=1 Tax=Rotaria sordida TaxID=392033 RepID=A0A815GKE5_9BILA|nr:unnamed protein product [Rotaria sordida]CAF1595932.1 unnamed protein product [Rotaria sordida]